MNNIYDILHARKKKRAVARRIIFAVLSILMALVFIDVFHIESIGVFHVILYLISVFFIWYVSRKVALLIMPYMYLGKMNSPRYTQSTSYSNPEINLAMDTGLEKPEQLYDHRQKYYSGSEISPKTQDALDSLSDAIFEYRIVRMKLSVARMKGMTGLENTLTHKLREITDEIQTISEMLEQSNRAWEAKQCLDSRREYLKFR